MPTTPTGSPDPWGFPTPKAAPKAKPKAATTGSPSQQPSLADLLKAARAATPQERRQIAKEVGSTGGEAQAAWRAASLLSHQLSELERLLGVSADEAALLLGEGHYSASADLEALCTKLANRIDSTWDDLAPQLELLSSLMGAQGRRLLRKASRLVNKAREKRGATAIAVVMVAAEKARAEVLSQVLRDSEEGESPTPAEIDEQVAARVQELAQEMLGEHIHQLGKDPSQLVAGYLTGSELRLLSDCKRWIEQHATVEILRDMDRYCAEVWKVFAFCKRRGYSSPAEAKRQMQERQQGIGRKINTTGWGDVPRVTDLAGAMDSLRNHLAAAAAAKGIPNAVPNAYPLP